MSDCPQRIPMSISTIITAAAICFFQPNFAFTQDFAGVQQRLAGAVKAGELSAEQAKIMMAALKQASAGKANKNTKHPEAKPDAKANGKHQYLQAVEEIKRAVEVGKLSKEDALAKINALKKQSAKGQKEHKHPETKPDVKANGKHQHLQAMEAIKRAVEVGKLSKEDALAKINALKKQSAEGPKEHKHPKTKPDAKANGKHQHLQAMEEIKRAVEVGKLSKEDAQAKINQLRKEMSPKAR